VSAIEIDNDHIIRLQQVLARSSGRGEHTIPIQPYGKISRGAWHEAEPIEPLAEPDEVSFQFAFRFPRGMHQGYPPV
jgi:hypothetical protein